VSFKDKTHYMVEPTSTTTIPLKGPSMYEYGHASPLALSVGMSVMLTTQAPLLGGHNDVNIPHWLGDKDLNCLYSTMVSFLFKRHLLKNKTHYMIEPMSVGAIPLKGQYLLRGLPYADIDTHHYCILISTHGRSSIKYCPR
jgi:hypothetical protein